MQIKFISPSSPRPSSLLGKITMFIVTVALAVVALMFSAVLLVVLFCMGAVAFAYLWWKTRELRKQMRNFTPPRDPNVRGDTFAGEVYEGEIIEGEAVRIEEPRR